MIMRYINVLLIMSHVLIVEAVSGIVKNNTELLFSVVILFIEW